MKTTLCAAALTGLLWTGCAGAPELPTLTSTDIGIHPVSFQTPKGWVHLDHGREHRFHRELAQISAADLGPVTAAGYLRELRHAHRLFRDYRYEDAAAHLKSLDLLPAFPDEHLRKRFFRSWRKAMNGGRSDDITHADAVVAWEYILEEVERLPEPDLAVLVQNRFPAIETAAHREIAERTELEIDGRAAIRLESWDRLSHDHRQAFLFVLNQGNLLMFRMEIGEYAELKTAFETLAGSLTFQSADATS